MKDGMFCETLMVTPDLAREWLARNTRPDQRKVKPYRVAQWADAMRRGDWQLSPQGLQFAADGTLLDGQHRLHAVVAAEKAVPFIVWRNVPTAVMPTLDAGAVRSAYDVLRLPKGVIACCRAMVLSLPPKNAEKVPIANNAMVGRVAEHYSDVMQWLADQQMLSSSTTYGRSYIVAQFAKAYVAGVDRDALSLVALALRTPADGSLPAINMLKILLAQRNGMSAQSSGATELALKAQRAIRASVDGESLKKLYAPPVEIFPPVPIPSDIDVEGPRS